MAIFGDHNRNRSCEAVGSGAFLDGTENEKMETASVDNFYSRSNGWREEWMGLFM